MADYNAFMDWALEFRRTGAFPLDRSTLFESLADAQKYAAGKATDPDSRGLFASSYVGQVISVATNNSATVYKIKADRTLEEVGRIPDVDGKSIEVASGNLQVFGFDEAVAGQIARVTNTAAEGEDPVLELEWFTPNWADETVAAIYRGYVDTLRGDASTEGSVDYKIAQFNTNVLEANYYNKAQVDSKISGALHYKGTVTNLGALLTAAGSTVYTIASGKKYYSDTELTTEAGTTSVPLSVTKVNDTYGTILVGGNTYYVSMSDCTSAINTPSTGDVYNITNAGGYDSEGHKIKAGDNVIFNGNGDGTNYTAAAGSDYYSDTACETKVGTLSAITNATYVNANYSEVELESTTYYVKTSSCKAPGWDLSAGTTDLSDYYTKEESNSLLNGKVDKVADHSLLADSEITRLAGLEAISDDTSGDGVITLTDKDGETRDVTVYTLPVASSNLGGIKSTASTSGAAHVPNVVSVDNSTGAATVDYVDGATVEGSVPSAEKVDHSLTIGSVEFDGSADATVDQTVMDGILTDYVKKTTYATTSAGGAIKSTNSTSGANHVPNVVSVDGNGKATVDYVDADTVEGVVSEAAKTSGTLTIGEKSFDGSADVEITASDVPIPDDVVTFTDIASTSKTGVIKSTASTDSNDDPVPNVVSVDGNGKATVDYVAGNSIVGAAPDANKLGGVNASAILVDNSGTLTSKVQAAAEADELATARTISFKNEGEGEGKINSDATFSVSFDGSADVTGQMVLKEVLTPAAGTYTKVTVNKKGLVTNATTLEAADIPSLTLSKISDAGSMASKNAVSETDFDSALATKAATWDTVTGKADAATTLAGYGITDAYTKSEVDGLVGSAFHYKGTKASFSALTSTVHDPLIGDVWNIVAAGGVDSTGTAIKAGDNVACAEQATVAAGKTYYSDTTLETEAGTLTEAAKATYVNDTYSSIQVGQNTYYVAAADVTAPQWDVLAGTVDLSAYKTWADTLIYTEGRYAKLSEFKALQREVLGTGTGYTAPSGTAYYSDTTLTTKVGELTTDKVATRVDGTYSSVTVGADTMYVHTSAIYQNPGDGSSNGLKYELMGSDGTGTTSGVKYTAELLNADVNTTGSVRQLIKASSDAITDATTGVIDTRIATHNSASDAHSTLFAAKQNKVIQKTVTFATSDFTAMASGSVAAYSADKTISELDSTKKYRPSVSVDGTAASVAAVLSGKFLPFACVEDGVLTVFCDAIPNASVVLSVSFTEIQD